jgi:hypothetical protein
MVFECEPGICEVIERLSEEGEVISVGVGFCFGDMQDCDFDAVPVTFNTDVGAFDVALRVKGGKGGNGEFTCSSDGIETSR